MAKFYPSLHEIKGLKVKPEKGETAILDYIDRNLDDTFEVFFNPFLNGDRPDIILVKENYGVFIIEVKDWKSSTFHLNENRKYIISKNGAVTKSPIKQVLKYKKNLYELGVEDLLELRIKDYRYWKIVNCGVYFHELSSTDIHNKIIKPFENSKSYLDFLKYNISFIGNDNLNTPFFDELLSKVHMKGDKYSYLFKKDLYDKFSRYLRPPIHTPEEGRNIPFSTAQKRLIVSSPRDQRVKGVVGSGKTTVLASRAVNSYKRTGSNVLILCYNITLRNYIHDKLSSVREKFSWGSFHILNYHDFIKSMMNNLGIEFLIPKGFEKFNSDQKSNYFESQYFSNLSLFDDYQDQIDRYDTILIDEVQDYRREWLDIIKDNFLIKDKGEYILFGDEKQNIYSNELENKDIKTNVRQRPTLMAESFRSTRKIQDIAIGFQNVFLSERYDVDNFNELEANTLFLDKSYVKYFNVSSTSVDIEYLYQIVQQTINATKQHPNDIAVLGLTIQTMRLLDCYYRYMSGEKTNSMFETQEVWFKIFMKALQREEDLIKGSNLIGVNLSKEDRQNELSVLLTLLDLIGKFGRDEFTKVLRRRLGKLNIDHATFLKWYENSKLYQATSKDRPISIRDFEKKFKGSTKIVSSLKGVRDNKKFHFWYNSGTIKFSTIHSFKGWEAETLILVIEPQYDYSDFASSFEELIYTGLTRSVKNLVVVNFGNDQFDIQLRSLLD